MADLSYVFVLIAYSRASAKAKAERVEASKKAVDAASYRSVEP